MAASAAAACNPAMGRFRQRLMDMGRVHRVAPVEVMDGLVIPASVLLRDGRGWSGARAENVENLCGEPKRWPETP